MYTKSMAKQKIYSDPDMGMPNVNSTGLNDQFKKKGSGKKDAGEKADEERLRQKSQRSQSR